MRCGGLKFFSASTLESSLQTAFQEWKEQILSSIKLEEPEAEENEDPHGASGWPLRSPVGSADAQRLRASLGFSGYLLSVPKTLVWLCVCVCVDALRPGSLRTLP